MTLEEQEAYLATRGREIAAGVAFHAAANAVAYLDPTLQGVFWPKLGRDRVFGDEMDGIVAFVRAGGPNLPAEALYRYCGGKAIHDADADGFDDVDRPWRVAFATFIATLPIQDLIIDDELARVRRTIQAAAGPVLAAALTDVPERDTILRRVPDPLETREGYVLVETKGDDHAAATGVEAVSVGASDAAASDGGARPAPGSAPEDAGGLASPAGAADGDPAGMDPVDGAADPYPLPPRKGRKG